MQDITHVYIDGRFVEPHGTELFDLHNPVTGEVFGRVRLGDVQDTRAAIAAAMFGSSSTLLAPLNALALPLASRVMADGG